MQVVYRRMCEIIGTKYLLGFTRLVGRPAIGDGHGGEDHALLVAQSDVLTDFQRFGELFVHVKCDRHRPERAIGQPHVLDHTVIIGFVEEPLKRVETTVHQQF